MTRLLFTAALLTLASPAIAQQPFPTDDANVTATGKFHCESFNEYDWLPTEQFPHLRQNTFNVKMNYGLGRGLELDVDAPLISITNDATVTPRVPFGLGDTNFGIKWNFRQEHDTAPALAAVFYVEVPTGDTTTQLGSGLVDTWLYGVVQKTLKPNLVLHLNGGWLFHGNTSTGVVGIVTAHGHVATMGGSLVQKVDDRIALGVDLTGAVTRNALLARNQLQVTLGGNYTLRNGLSLDAGFILGHFEASPRVGVQIGFSWDITPD